MQELPPRSQSVMQIRSSSSSFQFKASKIFQKVNNFREKIRLGNSSRKSHDGSMTSYPYNPSRHTPGRSMDLTSHIVAKPFMSQPMLPLAHQSQRNEHSTHDNARTSFSSQSESSSNSSLIRADAPLAATTQQHTLAKGLVNGTTTALSVAVGNRPDVGKFGGEGLPLPSQSHTLSVSSKQMHPSAPQSSDSKSRRDKDNGAKQWNSGTGEKMGNEKRVDSVGTSSNRKSVRSESGAKNKSNQDAEATRALFLSRNRDEPNTEAVPSSSSTKHTVSSQTTPDPTTSDGPSAFPSHTPRPSTSASVLSTHTTSSTATITPRNYRGSEAEHEIPPVPPISQPAGVSVSNSSASVTTSSTNSPSIMIPPITIPSNVTSTPQTPTAHLRRAFTSPKLNSPLPGHTRFSLTDGDSARLSPSIIIRQPVWPILHLPASGPTPSEQPAPSPVGSGLPSRRPSTSSTIGVRLRHMPALTMDGNGEHEEVNEEDLIDESESSEEEDEDAANSGDDGDEDGYESARSSTSANVASGPRTAPPVPPKDRETTTPKPSSLRTPRFGQFSGATHDYFSGVFSPSPSTPSRTAKEKPPFYVTPASTPFDQPPSTSTTPSNPPMLPPVLTTAPLSFPPFSLSPSTPTGRTGSNVHKRASKSMFDLSFSLPESGQDGVLDNVGGIGRKPSTKKLDEPPGDHNKKLDATTPIAPTSTTPIPIQTPTPGLPPSSSEDRQNPTPTSSSLKRRRSMPLFTPNSPPPPYPAFHHHHPQSLHAALSPPPHPSSSSAQSHPTDPPPPLHHDEGREELPAYSNSIYIRSVMPRKMEFIKPQVPAKDRKWRRVVCELEGTAFRVYEFRQKGAGNAGRVKEWWERRVGVGDVSRGVGIGGGTGGNLANASVNTGGGNTRLSGQAGNGEELSEEERARRRRMQKIDVNEGRSGDAEETFQETTEVRIPAPQSAARGRPVVTEKESHTRSKLASFLKGNKSHSRSNSEVSIMTQGRSQSGSDTPPTRSSLNSPRPSVQSSRSEDISEEPRDRLRHAPSRQSLAASSPLANQRSPSLRPSAVTSVSDPISASSTSPLSTDTSPSLSQSIHDCPMPSPGDLIKTYSLQHAESGLGNDYLKRKNVIRVRMGGEQFLLQAKDVAGVVEWIEGLHSAANVALDLDERPMPRGPLFPRRRRRRQRRPAEAAGEVNGNNNNANDGVSGANGASNGGTGALDPRPYS